LALGDLDNDGDLDTLIGTDVWLNDGTGVFAEDDGLSDASTTAVALGDLDGDGDLDALAANWLQPDKVWLNDGTATFSPSPQNIGYPPAQPSWDVALGDLDGDGDLDAIIATYAGHDNHIWLNDGLGVFVESGSTLGTSWIQALTLGDLDGDHDLDALAATDIEATRVWKNDGLGGFTDSGQSLGSVSSETVTLGDVDGDGDLDAFVDNEVWLNDGTGTFSASGSGLSVPELRKLALGDVDGDGDLDAFAGIDGPNEVWLNQKVHHTYLPVTLRAFTP
jgi:hypothetical protein